MVTNNKPRIYPIPNHEGYGASKDGRIWSRKISNKWKELSQRYNCKGYLRVTLFINKPVTISVHRLIGLTFCSNPNHYNEINHKDCNKENNKASNLEWVSRSTNVQHAIDNKLNRRDGEYNNTAKLTRNDVMEIRLNYVKGMTIKEIAKSYPVTRGQIRKIINRTRWK